MGSINSMLFVAMSGAPTMLKWFAGNWDSLKVCSILDIYIKPCKHFYVLNTLEHALIIKHSSHELL